MLRQLRRQSTAEIDGGGPGADAHDWPRLLPDGVWRHVSAILSRPRSPFWVAVGARPAAAAPSTWPFRTMDGMPENKVVELNLPGRAVSVRALPAAAAAAPDACANHAQGRQKRRAGGALARGSTFWCHSADVLLPVLPTASGPYHVGVDRWRHARDRGGGKGNWRTVARRGACRKPAAAWCGPAARRQPAVPRGHAETKVTGPLTPLLAHPAAQFSSRYIEEITHKVRPAPPPPPPPPPPSLPPFSSVGTLSAKANCVSRGGQRRATTRSSRCS